MSRASPVSTTIEARRRVLDSTRWWCTVPVARRDGTGIRSAEVALSEMTRICAPFATASSASLQRRSTAFSRPAFPSLFGQVASRMTDGNSLDGAVSFCLMLSSSCSKRIADSSWSTLAWSGVSSRMLRSAPRPASRVMTDHSRIGSIGGLVTCAKSWRKYVKRRRGNVERGASGMSSPMEKTASCPALIIGGKTMSRSSFVTACVTCC